MYWKLKELIEHASQNSTRVGDRWVPARPINWKHEGIIERLQNAWMAFIGRVDVFEWPEGQ